MILTVTMNPSIDYLYNINHLKLGRVNKTSNPTSNIGGKGINAGRAAALMGSDVILTGFLFGNNGFLIKQMLEKENLFTLDFLENKEQNNRNALTIMHDNHTHTEIVEQGPTINNEQKKIILNKIYSILKNNSTISTICISGSVNTKDSSFYKDLMINLNKNYPDKKVLLDISEEQLINVLSDKESLPFFIKPNKHEFSDLIKKDINTKQDIIKELHENSLFKNIPVVLVSCGKDGAVVKYEQEIFDVHIPKIDVINPTGAGDSTVGLFAYSIENDFSIHDSIKYAMAGGISNTLNENVGQVSKMVVYDLISQIKIKKIE